MNLLSESTFKRLEKEEEKILNFHEFGQKLVVLTTGDDSTSSRTLYRIKSLFQKMLPKMPREYIIRQVFDVNHFCVTLLHKNQKKQGETEQITGSVCYRPFFERNFVEIVFFAIDSDFHIKGYGTFLFNSLKQILKLQFDQYLSNNRTIYKNMTLESLDILLNPSYTPNYPPPVPLYLVTYADNSAIGFFKKQGFSNKPVYTKWIHYIKDYDGGTLMECKIFQQISYLRKKTLFEETRKKIFEKMKEINDYHIKRTYKDKASLEPYIEAYKKELHQKKNTITRGSYVFDSIDEDFKPYRKKPKEFLFDFIFYLLCDLQSDAAAWPFLQPVPASEVPDYYDIIKSPMDLSTMVEKHKNLKYKTLNNFTDDVFLMCRNCFTYNNRETQYYKCAEIIKKHYLDILKKHEATIIRWGFFD